MARRAATTDSSGNYSFKILPGTYTLSPVKTYEKNKTNGISTLDTGFADPDMEALRQKVNEMILNGRR
jgi:hypothetical protein